MAGQIRPAIRLPGATWNRIIQDKIAAMVEDLNAAAKGDFEFFPDGIMPGTVQLKDREKLQQYLNATTDITDFVRIADPGYEAKARTGLLQPDDPGPQSPFWKQAMMIPGMFTQMAKEYMALLEKYAKPQGKAAPAPAENAPQPAPEGVMAPMGGY